MIDWHQLYSTKTWYSLYGVDSGNKFLNSHSIDIEINNMRYEFRNFIPAGLSEMQIIQILRQVPYSCLLQHARDRQWLHLYATICDMSQSHLRHTWLFKTWNSQQLKLNKLEQDNYKIIKYTQSFGFYSVQANSRRSHLLIEY